jgi:AcrR family transcriptional regulator
MDDDQLFSPARHDRATRIESAILAAAREMLADGGVDRLTVEGVAARSGAAKTTIYRRWRSKEDLALAVILRMTEEVVRVPENGDTRSVLIAFVERTISALTDSLMGRVMQGLASDIATDTDLAHEFHLQVIGLRMQEVRHLVERGVERGELRAGIDVELMHDMLTGPVYHRLLLTAGELDPGLAERIVDAVLPSLQP